MSGASFDRADTARIYDVFPDALELHRLKTAGGFEYFLVAIRGFDMVNIGPISEQTVRGILFDINELLEKP